MSEDSEDFIFQQDGNPPHCHRDIRRFLNESLPQRWIGRVEKEDLALQFWPRDLLISHPETFSCGGFVKEAVFVPSLPTILDDLKKPHHTCGELSDARYSSSGVERIQLPSRCYSFGRRGAH
jgi:hypothetical protein